MFVFLLCVMALVTADPDCSYDEEALQSGEFIMKRAGLHQVPSCIPPHVTKVCGKICSCINSLLGQRMSVVL